jgi:hypothetical protein
MKIGQKLAVAAVAAMMQAAPVAAQDGMTAAQAKCELHVWPTENYVGINPGWLSGGIVEEIAALEEPGRARTVRDVMRDYLGPDVQMEVLTRLGLTEALQLKDSSIVVHEPEPLEEDFEGEPDLKARAKAMNARFEAKLRLSGSTHPCYAELITTHIFYFKAIGFGSNLVTGWTYREFGDQQRATRVVTGQARNPLELFPPETVHDVEAAKAELVDAFEKDFREYVAKKVRPGVR